MATWLHWILAILLTYPVVLIAGVLGGIVARKLPRIMYDDWLNISTVVLTILSLAAGLYFFVNKIHVWASTFFLLFAVLLCQFIPLFADRIRFAGRIWIVGELYRNLQFAISLAGGLYFCYTMLGLF